MCMHLSCIYAIMSVNFFVSQAFRESAVPGASELLQQLADAKTEEEKEAIKNAVVSAARSL